MPKLYWECDTGGRPMPSTSAGADWLWTLVARSRIVLRGLKESCRTWNEQDCPAPIEAVPGLWLVPMPIEERRSRIAYAVTCIPCAELLDSEYLHAMCQGAQLDATWCKAQLASLQEDKARQVWGLQQQMAAMKEEHERRLAEQRGEINALERQV